MVISYDKLWKLLIDKKMNKTNLKDQASITYNVLALLGKEKPVNLNTIPKYQGVPSCAYEIGELIVDRKGAIIIEETMTPAEVNALIRELETEGFMPTNYGENAFNGVEVAVPSEIFTDMAIENLQKIVLAKGDLIAKVIGSMDLRIIENEAEVRLPWFPKTESTEEIKHYTQFAEALCKMAIDRICVASTPKKSENENMTSYVSCLG